MPVHVTAILQCTESGFMDAHVHGMGVATKWESYSLIEVAIKENYTLEDYAKRMKEFIDEDFKANGKYWPYYKGNSVWVNSKAIEVFHIKDWTKRYSEDQLRIDEKTSNDDLDSKLKEILGYKKLYESEHFKYPCKFLANKRKVLY